MNIGFFFDKKLLRDNYRNNYLNNYPRRFIGKRKYVYEISVSNKSCYTVYNTIDDCRDQITVSLPRISHIFDRVLIVPLSRI